MRRAAAAACSMLLHAAVLTLPLVHLLAWSSPNFGGGVPFVELSAIEPARPAVSSATSRAVPRQVRAAARSVPAPALPAPRGSSAEPVASPAPAAAPAPQAHEAEPPLPALEFVAVAPADVPAPARAVLPAAAAAPVPAPPVRAPGLAGPAAALPPPKAASPAEVARVPEPAAREASELRALALPPVVLLPAGEVVPLPAEDDGPGAQPSALARALAALRGAAEAATITVRAEAGPFGAPGALFEFFLDRPELAAHLVRELQLGRYRVARTEQGLVLDDGWGSRLRFTMSAPAPGLRVLAAEARHEQAFVPDITGHVTMVIEYEIARGPDAADVVTASVTSHARIDGDVGQLLARIAGSALARKADREAQRLVRTFARLSQRIAADPARALALLERWPEGPQEDVAALARLLAQPGREATAR